MALRVECDSAGVPWMMAPEDGFLGCNFLAKGVESGQYLSAARWNFLENKETEDVWDTCALLNP